MKALLAPLFLSVLLPLLGIESHAQRAPSSAYAQHGVRASGYGVPHGASRGRLWSPGHYELVREPVWIPGCSERVWAEPVFEWRRDACGRLFRVELRAGYWKNISRPGHYEYRSRRVWRPGHWSPRCPG